jgi:hypothetical protein
MENGKVIEKNGIRIFIPEKIPLVVNYNQSLEKMIKDGGYDFYTPSITEQNFPLDRKFYGQKIKVLGRMFNFNYDVHSDAVKEEMMATKCYPAFLPEILSLGVRYPEWQRVVQIIALGSVSCIYPDNKCVTCLRSSGQKRWLVLNKINYSWDYEENFYFLGIYK